MSKVRSRKPPPALTDLRNTQIPALLSGALEVWAHQLLYQRLIYPRHVFGPNRFLGVRVKCCRHPQVVEYIRQAVHLAGPSLLQGAADQVVWSSFIGDNQVLEQYRLNVTGIGKQISSDAVESVTRDWERQVRNLVLSVLSIPQKENITKDNSLSFRIQVHVASPQNCTELMDAFKDGSWRESAATSHRRTTAPLHHIQSPVGQIEFLRERVVYDVCAEEGDSNKETQGEE